MITVLLVTRDDRWRERLELALPGASVFTAVDDADALRHLRRVETDAVLFAPSSAGNVERFVERVREAAPACVTVVVGDDSETLTTDFVIEESEIGRASCRERGEE